MGGKKAIDYSDRKQGRLTVIKRIGTKRGIPLWLCTCTCGKEKEITSAEIRKGSQSCGCLNREIVENVSRKHGLRHHKLYAIWTDVKTRCNNPNCKSYKNYGARGIKISDEWLDFQTFYNDMFPIYKEGLTLERINVNDNYCKENCTWIPRVEQSLNKLNTLYVTYENIKIPLKTLCNEKNANYMTIRNRIVNQGMTIEEALTKPIRKRR